MRPSPRIVAPEMPRMLAICGPTDLTTISRLPASSSVTSAVECSPARTRITGSAASVSGSTDGPLPTNEPRCWKRYTVPPYSNVGCSSSTWRWISVRVRRATPSTVAIGSAKSSSCTRTISACVIASVNGSRIVKRAP